MKIEFEIDDKELIDKIVERSVNRIFDSITHQLTYDIKTEVKKKVNDWFKTSLVERLQEMLKTMMIDNLSFEDKIKDLVVSPSQTEWHKRPLIQTTLDEFVRDNATKVLKEFVESDFSSGAMVKKMSAYMLNSLKDKFKDE